MSFAEEEAIDCRLIVMASVLGAGAYQRGKTLSRTQGDHLSEQQFYAGFVKPQEVAHDATLYRMYQTEAAEIEKGGRIIRRVVLAYELKKSIYAPLVEVKLMGLDFVLPIRNIVISPPKPKNLSSLWALGLKRECLPMRIYRLAEWSHPDYPVLRGQVPAVSRWRVHRASACGHILLRRRQPR